MNSVCEWPGCTEPGWFAIGGGKGFDGPWWCEVHVMRAWQAKDGKERRVTALIEPDTWCEPGCCVRHAQHAERTAIQTEHPIYNVVHNY